ncbi:hypothetical protein, partial [Neisseria sicca]|uniref:hypothetical protein n=1 Tax=Neisseria sicca TaxID=490 RepID=UPI001C995509
FETSCVLVQRGLNQGFGVEKGREEFGLVGDLWGVGVGVLNGDLGGGKEGVWEGLIGSLEREKAEVEDVVGVEEN